MPSRKKIVGIAGLAALLSAGFVVWCEYYDFPSLVDLEAEFEIKFPEDARVIDRVNNDTLTDYSALYVVELRNVEAYPEFCKKNGLLAEASKIMRHSMGTYIIDPPASHCHKISELTGEVRAVVVSRDAVLMRVYSVPAALR